MKRSYDSTVARIAGNLLSGATSDWMPGGEGRAWCVKAAVATARAIIAEVEQTEPVQEASA